MNFISSTISLFKGLLFWLVFSSNLFAHALDTTVCTARFRGNIIEIVLEVPLLALQKYFESEGEYAYELSRFKPYLREKFQLIDSMGQVIQPESEDFIQPTTTTSFKYKVVLVPPRKGKLYLKNEIFLDRAALQTNMVRVYTPNGLKEYIAAFDYFLIPLRESGVEATKATRITTPPQSKTHSNSSSKSGHGKELIESYSKRPASWYILVKSGIHHIFIGLDHLLFLVALFLGCTRFWNLLGLVTAFTLAHSLTLLLTSMSLIGLPAWLVETGIAFSIAYLGWHNLRSEGEESRYLEVFSFGLLHGMGFASVFQELGFSGMSLVWKTLFFNLGVEFGQAAFLILLIIVLGLFGYQRRRELFMRYGSFFVMLFGIYWVLDRLEFLPVVLTGLI